VVNPVALDGSGWRAVGLVFGVMATAGLNRRGAESSGWLLPPRTELHAIDMLHKRANMTPKLNERFMRFSPRTGVDGIVKPHYMCRKLA